MKRVILIAFCIALICFTQLVSAEPTSSWLAYLRIPNSGTFPDPQFTFGTSSSPQTAFAPVGNGASPVIGEPNGSAYLYSKDIRPSLSAGESCVWNVILYCQPSYAGSSVTLSGFRQTALQDLDVSLWMGQSKLWDIDASSNFSITLPRVYEGNPYSFQIRATALPEPASLCGLLAGFMGMGIGIYRRHI